MFWELLTYFHDALLMALTIFGVLYVSALLRTRFSLKNVLTSWYTPHRFYLPRWILLGMIANLGLWMVLTVVTGKPILGALGVYAFITFAILLTGLAVSRTLVTEKGIVQRIGNQKMWLAWGQVEDYVVHERAHGEVYVFFCRNEHQQRMRCELLVPKNQSSSFRKIVEKHLDARFNFLVYQSFGSKALND